MSLFQIRDYREILPREVFPSLRLSWIHQQQQYCLIIADQVGVVFDELLNGELKEYYGAVFGESSEIFVDRPGNTRDRTTTWMGTLQKLEYQKDFYDIDVSKDDFLTIVRSLMAGENPSPPPSRPDLTPAMSTVMSPPIYSLPPFRTITKPSEVFYRFEPWPTSRRINQGDQSIAAETYAAPESELFFAPTGFAAVARYALPQIFPAVFRWELQPARTTILCGAVVPRFGQSGGGVEVYFPQKTRNAGPIANPVVLDPL